MEKICRKQIKTSAKRVIKGHYFLLLLVCLIASVLGTKFSDALDILKIGSSDTVTVSESTDTSSDTVTVSESTDTSSDTVTASESADTDSSEDASDLSVSEAAKDAAIQYFGLDGAYNAIIKNQVTEYAKWQQKENESKSVQIGMLQIGRNRGVLAALVNQVNGGTLLIMFYNAIHGVVTSKNALLILYILIAIFVYLAISIFITDVYEIIMSRTFLEACTYEKVPLIRLLYLIRVRRWIPVSLALFRKTVYELLWSLTIVGGFIKRYSYFCVPFLLAENPNLSGKDAILLSRRMMNGHKLEAFVLELSFFLWFFLDIFTYHLLGLFFLNSYKTATLAEYYAQLRGRWILEKGEGYEYLCDRYLFEKPDSGLLSKTYSDIEELKRIPEENFEEGHAFAKFMAKNFGIILRHDEEEMKYLRRESRIQRIENFSLIIDGKMYPSRLSPIPEKEKDPNLEGTGYLRCYTITSLILIFFTMCIAGWVWEVTLHLLTDHEFVNRGVLHGPWLPIYGTGGMVILLLLKRFRKNMNLEFVLSMVLAGIVEYMTAWQLEITHNGQKWWDYSGYFLNLHGRICAEGLLVFGIGGIAIVYVLAPMLDNLFRRLSKKTAIRICAVLLIIYIIDQIYSAFYPNKGKGITDYTASRQAVEISETFCMTANTGSAVSPAGEIPETFCLRTDMGYERSPL